MVSRLTIVPPPFDAMTGANAVDIATVDSISGVVTGVNGGVATITATSEGVSGSVALTVKVPVATVTVAPALDTLELSLKHHDDANLKMIEKQFLDSLKRLGIEKFGTVGEEFDPARHEALAKQSDEHKILSVERSGYKTKDTIIRPAQVII